MAGYSSSRAWRRRADRRGHRAGWLLVLVPVLLGVSLTACGSVADDGFAPSPTPPPVVEDPVPTPTERDVEPTRLVGTGPAFGPRAEGAVWYLDLDYRATRLTIDGRSSLPRAEHALVVRFPGPLPDLVTARAGTCSLGGGSITTSDGWVQAADWSQVAEGCDAVSAEVTEAVARLFTGGAEVRVDGVRVQLATAEVVLELDPTRTRHPEILRCVSGDLVITQPPELIVDPSAEVAMAQAVEPLGYDPDEFVPEGSPRTWILGPSTDPVVTVDLYQRDAAPGWHVLQVRECPDGGTVDSPVYLGPVPDPDELEPMGRGPLIDDNTVSVPFRLLVEDGSAGGTGFREARLIDSADELSSWWADTGLVGPVPAVDPAATVVLHIPAVHGSSCWFGSVQSLLYDPSRRVLRPYVEVLHPPGSPGCLSDAQPHHIIIAVDRVHWPVVDGELFVASIPLEGRLRPAELHVIGR